MTQTQIDLWALIARCLSEALSQVENQLVRGGLYKDVSQIREFIEENELGLAFDYLSECIEELKLTIEQPTAELIEKAKILMNSPL